jgi:hypothetical protein
METEAAAVTTVALIAEIAIPPVFTVPKVAIQATPQLKAAELEVGLDLKEQLSIRRRFFRRLRRSILRCYSISSSSAFGEANCGGYGKVYTAAATFSTTVPVTVAATTLSAVATP